MGGREVLVYGRLGGKGGSGDEVGRHLADGPAEGDGRADVHHLEVGGRWPPGGSRWGRCRGRISPPHPPPGPRGTLHGCR